MSVITTINSGDLISGSRTDINNNFASLNTNKIETSVLDTDTSLTANSDLLIPSQKAVKAYVDVLGGANASETVRGIVEEATDAEVTAGTATGATGAKLFVTPAKLLTNLTTVRPANDVQIFTANGTWTKPTGAKRVSVTLIGGGGGSGFGGGGNQYGSGGGGGGAINSSEFSADLLTPTITVTVGAKGVGGASGGVAGTSGGNTTFGSYLNTVGGSGTSASPSSTAGGNGGVTSISGGNGGNGGTTVGNGGGGGGGGAGGGGGSNSTGSNGGAGGTAGTTFSLLGAGGSGGIGSSGGIIGSNYGGGGGGSGGAGGGNAGKDGGAGYAIVTTFF